MRKANERVGVAKKQTIETAKAVPDSIIKLIATQEEKALKGVRDALAYYRNEIRYRTREIENLKQNIIRQTANAESQENLIKSLEKTIDHSEDLVKAQALYDSLMAYTWVESVEAADGYVKVITKLIFTDIRTEAGSKENKRTCLGSFEIQFNLSQHGWKIINRTFPGTYDTWSVDNHNPCLGEWQRDVVRLHDKKDWAALIDLFYHYIRAADTDGSAYMRSHAWRDSRSIGNVEKLPVGTYVVIIADYNDVSLVGVMGKITNLDGNMARVDFKETVESLDGDGEFVEEYDSLWLSMNILIPITKAEYDKGEAVKHVNALRGVFEKLDALKDGSTQTDAEKIIKKI